MKGWIDSERLKFVFQLEPNVVASNLEGKLSVDIFPFEIDIPEAYPIQEFEQVEIYEFLLQPSDDISEKTFFQALAASEKFERKPEFKAIQDAIVCLDCL